jgi:hypothetical protein
MTAPAAKRVYIFTRSHRSILDSHTVKKVGWLFDTHCGHRIIGKLCRIWVLKNSRRRKRRVFMQATPTSLATDDTGLFGNEQLRRPNGKTSRTNPTQILTTLNFSLPLSHTKTQRPTVPSLSTHAQPAQKPADPILHA